MLESVVVLPWPPALVPELMGRAAGELTPLRRVVDAALSDFSADLLRAAAQGAPPQVVVVGPGEHAEHQVAGSFSFADFGLDVRVPALGAVAEVADRIPTPLMVARYLVSRVVSGDGSAEAALWSRARWLTTDEAHAQSVGAELAAQAGPLGLVVLADGAACHGPKAPRAEDSRAERYDETVARALAAADVDGLLALDVGLGHELGASGAPLWPLLARAAMGSGLSGQVRWRGAPYGVGWTVAAWRPAAALAG